MRYELAIFDLDGTILNTLDDLADSLNTALVQSGFPARSYEEVRRFVGNGIRRLIERAMPQGATDTQTDRVQKDFLAHYQQHCADKTRPYDGIVPLLETLRASGVRTAVVSNKIDEAVQPLCEKYFPGLFDAAVGERIGILAKPAPDSVNEVLRHLNVLRQNAVYIGDSEVDIQTAKNAQMGAILVDWGFRDRDFLIEQGATIVVSSTDALKAELL